MATAIICIILVIAVVAGVKSYMKKLRSGCCGASSEPSVKKVKVKDKDPSHYPYKKVLKIYGMTCGNGANRVENALTLLDGVYATVDLMKEEAVVRMKEELEDQTLKKTVAAAGYTVYKVTERTNFKG